MKDPGRGKGGEREAERSNNLPVCILYGSWNFWNYCLLAWKKKIPFWPQNRLKPPLRPPLPSLAVGFGQTADYPVVIATANRKCPAAGKARGFVPVFSCLGEGALSQNRARKIQRGASASSHARSFVPPPRRLLYHITLLAEHQQMLYYFSSLEMPGPHETGHEMCFPAVNPPPPLHPPSSAKVQLYVRFDGG